MKIALYLGSFNPFHNGHLEVVKTALSDFEMDKVIIVPTMQNPWKKEKPIDIDLRIEIIKKYLEDLKYTFYRKNYDILISSIEKELIPPYYSYATLHALKNKYCNDEVFVLIGEDTVEKIPEWMHGEQIIKDYDFLIVDRSENSISSTEIRQKIRKDESIYGLVPNIAINLIKKYYYGI